ncbi:unnamed protein product [Tilletia controversa]|uniref:Translation initiation factor eIF2B subunit beta n=3 Tax=Tilletia TaxID=13289 RepID=A0A8X7SXA2_9BASI|nr:hypothetical protein CF336_g3193 [Tilletia laevis]KAE8200497.1 hypothetical protein CF328_g2948 [Tilletia controversa]KAE8264709.1 hypothetical protein A4X03_0g759 [Tilletia caries]KAE8203628.1 hypothetical protein CF335_g2946 [Tilletia laevis]KAE8247794.1 hypothetical protein A4X06_0g4187 [Tilletia controversa]
MTAFASTSAAAASTAPCSEAELKRAIPDRSARNAILAFALRLRRQQDPSLQSARTLATTTALVLRSIVRAHPSSPSSSSSSSIQDLVNSLTVAGAYLQHAARSEQTIGNTVRRIITIMQEEAISAVHNAAAPTTATSPSGPSLVTRPLSTTQSSILSRMSSAAPSPAALSRRASTAHVSSTALTSAAFQIAAGTLVPQVSSPTELGASISSGSAPGTGTTTPHHPVRPGLASLPSAFGSFSIADLVSVGSSQGVATPGPTSKLAMSPLGGSEGLSGAGLDTPDRSVVLGRARSIEASAADEQDDDDDGDDQTTQKQDDDTEEGDGEKDEEEEATAKDGLEDDQDMAEEDDDRDLGIKPLLIQAIQEYIDEIDSVPSSIAKDARDHIHSGETILTLGRSRTIEAFLKAAAAKDRHFTVIVPEGAPNYDGHHLARALAHILPTSNPVLLIPDSAVQPLMPRISKVLLSAHSILPNGGILTHARGATLASLAASEMRRPVVVLAGVFKVCPDWSAIGASGDAAAAAAAGTEWEYVDPARIDVLITNVGEHPPSYVYRLVRENYHAGE